MIDWHILGGSVMLLIGSLFLRYVRACAIRAGICMWPFCPPCERHCRRRRCSLQEK